METKYYERNRILIFKITEEIDECKVKEMRRKADYEIERFIPKKVVLDFNRVVFFAPFLRNKANKSEQVYVLSLMGLYQMKTHYKIRR